MTISIDIGTSYSSICMLGEDGRPQPVDINTGISTYGSKYSLPSAVCVDDEGELLVGQAAMNGRIKNPGRFRMEFKRDIGSDIPIPLGEEKSFRSEDFYTAFFRHMKACAEKVNSESVEIAYITYPASFGKRKREKILKAAKAAGLFQVELVDEPSAAAMSFLGKKAIRNGQNVLVYDFGGGTFDVSLLQYENGGFTLLTQSCGIERCGGIDMDRMIYQDIIADIHRAQLHLPKENTAYWKRLECSLAEKAMKAKHHLTTAKNFDDDIEIGFDLFSYHLSRERFGEMIAGLAGQTITICREILQNAGMEVKDLSAVFMVGGSSRIPLVQEMVRQFAGEVPVQCAENLELAVAEGALKFYGQQMQIPEGCSEETAQYFRLARWGDADAQFHLGDSYLSGNGIEESEEEGIKWYQRSARQGHREAQYKLVYYFLNRTATEKGAAEAVKWSRKLAEQGEVNAQCILGYCYENGIGTEVNKEEAVKCYRRCADAEREERYLQEDFSLEGIFFIYALYRLGDCYYDGAGVDKNEREAGMWYAKIKEDVFFYWLRDNVKDVFVKKYDAKRAFWKKKSFHRKLYLEMLHYVGDRFYYGIGVEKDEKWAVEYCYSNYYELAELGAEIVNTGVTRLAEPCNIDVILRIGDYYVKEGRIRGGFYYERARNFSANEKEEVKCCQKLAELGDWEIEYYLGECYLFGRGVEKNVEKALNCYMEVLRAPGVFRGADYRYADIVCMSIGILIKYKHPVALKSSGTSEKMVLYLLKLYKMEREVSGLSPRAKDAIKDMQNLVWGLERKNVMVLKVKLERIEGYRKAYGFNEGRYTHPYIRGFF